MTTNSRTARRFSSFAALSLLAAAAACGGPDTVSGTGGTCTAEVSARSLDPLADAMKNPGGWSCSPGAEQLRTARPDARSTKLVRINEFPGEGGGKLVLVFELRPDRPGNDTGGSGEGLEEAYQ